MLGKGSTGLIQLNVVEKFEVKKKIESRENFKMYLHVNYDPLPP